MLFAQLMDFLPWTSFARSVARYGGDRRVRNLSCAEQFRAMAFAQLWCGWRTCQGHWKSTFCQVFLLLRL